MYPQQHGRIPYFSKLSIAIVPVLLVGIFFTVQLARIQQQGSIGAWYTSQAATAKCDTSGATIGVSFTNTETDKSLGMNVIAKDVQTGTSIDMGSIAAGQTKTAMIVS